MKRSYVLIYAIVLTACGAGCARNVPPNAIEIRDAPRPHADALGDAFRDAVDRLPSGALAYNVPTTMRVGETVTIGAIVSRAMSASIARQLRENGPVATTAVRVSSGMRAHLYGDPERLRIVSLQGDGDEQTFDADGHMQWHWNVTPTRAAPADLELLIEAAVDVPDLPERHFRTVKDVRIPVRANLPYAVRRFAAANWQWAWSTLLVPFAFWLVRQGRSRRKPVTP